MKPAYPPSGEIAEKPKPSSSSVEESKSSGSGSSGLKRRLGPKTGPKETEDSKQVVDEFERDINKNG